MNKLLLLSLVLGLGGCAQIREYWPRSHDPVFVSAWVDAQISLDSVDCKEPRGAWRATVQQTQRLWMLADFRSDPQAENLKGLYAHSQRMDQSASTQFCELGKKTAQLRLDQTRRAWEGR